MEQEGVARPRSDVTEAENLQTWPSGVAYAPGRDIFLVCWGLDFSEAAW